MFVSSTFSDLKAERNALQEKVYPQLRKLCEAHGFRFQSIDLRWGISEETSIDQKTMSICLGEIKRCQQISPRPNFIILLGDRYGWSPLPEEIPTTEFEKIRCHILDQNIIDLFTCWYREDKNSIPPVYVLQARKEKYEDYRIWESQVETPLRTALNEAAAVSNISEDSVLKYGASATHQEIVAGTISVEDASEHVFCSFRKIEGIEDIERAQDFLDLDSNGKLDNERHSRLEALKIKLRKHLNGNIHHYNAQWTGNDITLDHIDRLCADVYKSLSQIILREIAQMDKTDPFIAELNAHKKFRQVHVSDFVGRRDSLEAINQYLESDNRQPFVVWGESGCGKSSLLAKAAKIATEKISEVEVICRYLGATPDSINASALMKGICQQISRLYGEDDINLSKDYRELIVEFPRHLALATAQRPMVLFLDALDQLSNIDNARSLIWLPVNLPEHVRVVVSTTPNGCLDSLKQKVSPENLMKLNPMSYEEGASLLETWLKNENRTLQEAQWTEVLNKFKNNGLPLYLRLSFDEARRWHSYDKTYSLSEEINGIINELFNRLSSEANHGETLVSRSLGYILAAKNGLSEDEIVDVLSNDKDVMAAFRRRSPKSPEVNCLPVIVWSRLYADLEPYLMKRAADGTSLITFFHRKLSEVARRMYLSKKEKAARHKDLAKYFRQQLLYIKSHDTQHENQRKLSELPYQWTHSAQWEKLLNTLTDFNFILAKVKSVGPKPLIEDIDEAFQVGYQSDILRRIQNILWLTMYIIDKDPNQLAGQIIGRLPQSDEVKIQKLLNQIHQWNEAQWLCPLLPTLVSLSGPLLFTLTGHTDWVQAVAVSQNGQRAVSASDDKTLKVWDLNRFEELFTLSGHTDSVMDVVLTPDGKNVISAAADGTMKVWDLAKGVIICTLHGHNREIITIDVTPDGRKLISGEANGVLYVWDFLSKKELFRLEGHTDWVRDVIVTPDGQRVISVSDDETMRVWDLEQKKELKTINTFGSKLNAVAVTPDGQKAICALANRRLKICDLQNGELLDTLTGHGDWVRAVAVTSDGNHAVSASDDKKLIVWDLKDMKPLRTLRGHTKAVWDVVVMPDDQRVISVSGDHTLKIWDLRREETHRDVFGHENWGITAVAVTPDGRRLISGSSDKSIKIWDLNCGEKLQSLKGHEGFIGGLAVSPDGRLLISGSGDKTLKVWDLEQQRLIHTLTGHTGWVNAVKVIPNGSKAVSASHDRSLSVWDLERGEEIMAMSGHGDDVTGVAVTPDGKHIVSASFDMTLKMWNLERGEECFTLRGHDKGLRDVAVTHDGRWAISASEDKTLKIWDLHTRTEIGKLSGHSGVVWKVDVAPNGQFAISASEDKTLRFWDLEKRQCLAVFTAESPIRTCAIAPNGITFVAGEAMDRLHILDLK